MLKEKKEMLKLEENQEEYNKKLQSCQHATQEKTSDEHKASNFYLLNKSTTRKIK